MKELSVLIISYNTRDLTHRCLSALTKALAGIDSEIIVVDNASADGSAQVIREVFPLVHVIDNPRNAGFGAANNIAMAAASGKYLLLLNSDAFPEAGSVRILLDAINNSARTGVVGPRLLNADGSLQRSVFRFPSPLQALLENLWLSRLLSKIGLREDFESWPHAMAGSVPWVAGACMIVKREVFEKVGGFDERFFMYSEETDWQKCIRSAGYDIRFEPSARVTHLGGASGASDKSKVNGMFFESLDLYVKKHHGRGGLVVLRAAMVFGCAARGAIWWVLGRVHSARRPVASTKASFHWWLARRQLLQWKAWA